MNWLHAGLTVVVWLSLGSLTPAHGQGGTCTNSCAGGTCDFEGLQNVAVGNATLSIDASCDLVVDNIGGGGADGVDQVNLDSTLMATELKTPNLSLSATGTRVEVRQVGLAGGMLDQELMFTRLVNFNDDDIELNVNCSAVLVQSYEVQIYNGAALARAMQPSTA